MPNVSVYVKESIYDQLRSEARKKGISVSELIRKLVEERYGG